MSIKGKERVKYLNDMGLSTCWYLTIKAMSYLVYEILGSYAHDPNHPCIRQNTMYKTGLSSLRTPSSIRSHERDLLAFLLLAVVQKAMFSNRARFV